MKRTGLLFIAVPLANGVSSVLALPAITSSYGSTGWASLAIGLAIGTAGGVILEMGWSVDGPLRVARSGKRSRELAYVWSVRMRLAILPVVLVFTAVPAALISTEFKLAAALMAVAAAVSGLSPAWYFNGIRSPEKLLLTDALPRFIATAASAIFIYMGNSIIVYPLLLIFVGCCSPVLAARLGGIKFGLVPRLGFGRLRLLFLIQFAALRGRIAGSMIKSLPVAIVGLVAPEAVAVFASAERLQKMALQFLNSYSLFMAGWIGAATKRNMRLVRASRGIYWSVGIGIISGALFALIAPFASKLIFSGTSDVDPLLAWIASGVISVTVVARSHVTRLLVRRMVNTYSNASWFSALMGVSMIVVLANLFGAIGAMIGEVIAEVAGLSYQMISEGKYIRANRQSDK